MKTIYTVLLFLIPNYLFSTTIIIVIHDNIITIGADSKVFMVNTQVKNGITTHDFSYSTTCKIIKNGDFICTGDGFYADAALMYSKGVFNKSNDIDSQIKLLSSHIISKLTRSIEIERIYNRKVYRKYCKQEFFASVDYCFFEKGKAVVYEIAFGCTNKENQKVIIHSRIKKSIDGMILTAGETKVIDPLIRAGEAFSNKSIAKGIYDLIEMEIKDEPDMVGKPINVIEITDSGKYNWIYNTNCKF